MPPRDWRIRFEDMLDGECARLVDDEAAALAPDVPWQDVRDMRNLLVHEYFGVDLVWATVQTDLQPLAESLRHALASAP